MVPYYSSDEEGGDDDGSDDSEDETREMLGSPSPSEEEEAVVSRLSREGGVSFLLLSRREVSARQDAMTYLVRVRGLLMDGES